MSIAVPPKTHPSIAVFGAWFQERVLRDANPRNQSCPRERDDVSEKRYFVHGGCSGTQQCVSSRVAHARTRARTNRPIVDSGHKLSHYTEDVTALQRGS